MTIFTETENTVEPCIILTSSSAQVGIQGEGSVTPLMDMDLNEISRHLSYFVSQSARKTKPIHREGCGMHFRMDSENIVITFKGRFLMMSVEEGELFDRQIHEIFVSIDKIRSDINFILAPVFCLFFQIFYFFQKKNF